MCIGIVLEEEEKPSRGDDICNREKIQEEVEWIGNGK